ncbi:MAG: PorV/PorQ family protein [candidate division Zixibacteria bacterium]|nr:PorV/PorQ family protein [candidate division Zixibacteria bacterium]MDH3937099.1 PorV/PorQ family protein [candidate division Zixibacteria bacterium]MDH4033057.1 PorV/PorQ family protein [candidate division Zixibacteria bacterium]
MRKIIWLMLLLMVATTASAGHSKMGSAGAQFLKIGVGSRYQGTGEASVAMANDVYAMFWNPAGLVEVENSAIGFTNVNWLLDIDLNYVGYAKHFEDIGVFGVSAAVLSMEDQEITTLDDQDGTGDFYSAVSYAVGVSYARQLTDRFAFGGSFKYVGERIHKENASTFAFDFGTLLYTGFKSLRMGMSITNMGPDLQFSGPDLDVAYDELDGDGANTPIGASVKTTPYDLPMMFRFGLAYDFAVASKSDVTISAEMKHPNDSHQQGSIGAEWQYDEMFFLRSGYKFQSDEEGLSFGGGLITNISGETDLLIDYAWQDFGRLQSTHRFSVGFNF